MRISPTSLQGSWVIETEPFEDKRGRFARFFCWKELQQIHGDKCLKQINYSLTLKKGAIRGMHFQYPPNAEVKFVRCSNGSVFDVIVDLRKGSETFLQWHGEELSGENMRMLYVPEGFAHGFQTLQDNCEMLYLHTGFYKPSHEGGLRYNDPQIGIKWPLEVTEISDRDRNHPLLSSDFEGIAV